MTMQNPHDRFFRQSFQAVAIARSYLQTYLAQPLQQTLGLEDLALQEGSFIDAEMQVHQTDLIYQPRLRSGELACVYFLFEHKSYPDPHVAFQLLRYMVRFWERQELEALLALRLGVPEARCQACLEGLTELEDLRMLLKRVATVETADQFETALITLEMTGSHFNQSARQMVSPFVMRPMKVSRPS